MKIRTSSDWREALPFELPVPAAEAAPGDPARCAGCGADAAPLPRAELWVVKHRHPNNPAGFVRRYGATPRPAPVRVAAPSVAATTSRRTPASRTAASRTPAVAKPTIPERPAVLCPDCFVEVPPTGACGMCGQRIG